MKFGDRYIKFMKDRYGIDELYKFLLLICFVLIVINTFISSSPSRIVNTIIKLYNDGNLFNHIWTTIYETLISFGIGTLIGIAVIFFFLINLLCSSLYMEINILPYLIIILFKFFFISITNRSTLILHFNIINTLNPCWSIR